MNTPIDSKIHTCDIHTNDSGGGACASQLGKCMGRASPKCSKYSNTTVTSLIEQS